MQGKTGEQIYFILIIDSTKIKKSRKKTFLHQ